VLFAFWQNFFGMLKEYQEGLRLNRMYLNERKADNCEKYKKGSGSAGMRRAAQPYSKGLTAGFAS
jgi:hypothetical protein